jgi:hypothetical protein
MDFALREWPLMLEILLAAGRRSCVLSQRHRSRICGFLTIEVTAALVGWLFVGGGARSFLCVEFAVVLSFQVPSFGVWGPRARA